MEDRYKIVYKGELRDGVSLDSVTQNFAALFKIPIEKASAILKKDSLVLKKDLSLEQANIFQKKLLLLGMVTEKIRQDVAANTAAHTVSPVPVSPSVTLGNNQNQQYSTKTLNAEVPRPQSKVGVYQDIRYYL